tara:strand:+ start:31232 stop:32503 length:1272 start_codon:yes stop_codon:yes gene_type:complete
MSLIKTSSWSLIIVLVSTIVGFINQKIYALFIGNEGIVILGNFNNFSSLVYILASGGIYSGIVSLIASSKNADEKSNILKKIYTILFYYSIIVAFFLFLSNQWIYSLLYNKELNVSKFINFFFYLNLPIIIILNGILYVLNGERKIKKYVSILITLNILNLLSTYFLVKFFKINGALLSVFIPSVLTFFLWISFLKEHIKLPTLNFLSTLKSRTYKVLIKFSIVTIFSTFLLSISQIIIRKLIINSLSIEFASYWQILTNFSKIWMGVVAGIFSMYFFPLIASIDTKKKLQNEVVKFLGVTIPFLSIVFFFIYILREYIIQIVYSKEFLDASYYFGYQLIGDIFKTAGLTFGYVLLAKKNFKLYLISEFSFYLLYICLSILLNSLFSLTGVFLAYIFSYITYLCIQIYFYYIIKKKHENTVIR